MLAKSSSNVTTCCLSLAASRWYRFLLLVESVISETWDQLEHMMRTHRYKYKATTKHKLIAPDWKVNDVRIVE